MRGASRTAMADARQALSEIVGSPGAAPGIGEELFAVTGLLDREPGLRRALTDASGPVAARQGLVRGLLSEHVSAQTLELVAGMSASRWSAPRDLADASERLAVMATAAAAEAGRRLDDLEDELFRFGRIVSGSPELRAALSNPRLAAERKRALLDALLSGRVTPEALRLISQAAAHPRGRSLDESLDEYAGLVAGWRERLIALVRVATELTAGQRARLATALAATYGHDIHLNVMLDPEVVGGLSVQVGDEFIDGSVASRLAVLRRKLAA